MRTTAGSRRSKRRCPRIKKLDSLEIEDPVAIGAQAAFAEISAETATQEAIRAAGWNAQAVASKTEPPPEAAPVESEYSFEALAALDSIIPGKRRTGASEKRPKTRWPTRRKRPSPKPRQTLI